MNFGASDPLQDYQISEFGGVDFSTLENKVTMARSPDAINMMMNHNGYLEKRTGYRRLFQGDDRINGIFDYKPKDSDETFYFMHVGTNLYRITFSEEDGSIILGEHLMSDLQDTKTRHFVYNDRLYILGCGYIQIRYNQGALEYGYLNKIGTKTEIVDYLEGRTASQKNGTIMTKYICTDACYKAVYYDCSPAVTTLVQGAISSSAEVAAYRRCKNLYIPTEASAVRIVGVYVRVASQTDVWEEWNMQYVDVSTDGKTVSLLYNPLYDQTTKYGESTNKGTKGYFEFDRIKIVYYEGGNVTAPLVTMNRTALPIKRFYTKNGYEYDNADGYFAGEYETYKDATQIATGFGSPFDGDMVDATNFAHGRRRIQFVIPDATDAICAYMLYLTGEKEKAIINRISIDGVVLQNYNHLYTVQYTAGSGSNLYTAVSSADTIYIDENGRCLSIITSFIMENPLHSDTALLRFNENVVTGSVVEVDFTVIHDEDSDNEQISACSIYGIYGGNNDTRVFLSGNPKYKNRDYASALYDATYFPNSMYTDVGSSASAIVGYHKLYSNQIVVKDDATEDASQYLRSLNIDDSGNVTYTLIQGQSTYGGCCASSFKNVAGLPFYLGPTGAYTIAGTTVQNQNNTVLRSLQINKHFLSEDLTNAVCCRFEDNYIVATGSHLWFCDTQHGLEWFYFDSLPEITCIWPHNGFLYFGSADGRVCVFSKREDKNAYYDNLNPDGTTEGAVPVKCYWCTPISAFDNWNMYKTIVNVYLSIMPHGNTSVHVYYNSSDNIGEDITTEDVRLFDFNNIDFENFTFDAVRQPKPFATGVKSKNVYVFGVKLANDRAQPFGIVSVGYKYKYSKYIK